MADDNEIEVVYTKIVSQMDKRVELITFDKDYRLQYKGDCTVLANEYKQSLIVKHPDEEDTYLPIGRQFIHVKNMVCVLGPKRINDIVVVFNSGAYCDKIYDFVVRKKLKFNCAPQESVLEQLYDERFLTPLKLAASQLQIPRLQEILDAVINEPIIKDEIINNDSDIILATGAESPRTDISEVKTISEPQNTSNSLESNPTSENSSSFVAFASEQKAVAATPTTSKPTLGAVINEPIIKDEIVSNDSDIILATGAESPRTDISEVKTISEPQNTSNSLESNPTSVSPPEPVERIYAATEIFGPENSSSFVASASEQKAVAATSTTSKPTPSGTINGIPAFQPSASVVANVRNFSNNSTPSCSNNGNIYRMPALLNMPHPNFTYQQSVNPRITRVLVPKPTLYSIPMTSPSTHSNNGPGGPVISSPFLHVNGSHMFHSNSSNTVRPNVNMRLPYYQMVQPRYYIHHQFRPNPDTPNLSTIHQNMRLTSPHSNVSMGSSVDNRPLHSNSNLSSSATPTSSRNSALNNSYGTAANVHQFSRSVDSNSMSSSKTPMKAASNASFIASSSSASNPVASNGDLASQSTNTSQSAVVNDQSRPSNATMFIVPPQSSADLNAANLNNTPSSSSADQNIPLNPSIPTPTALTTTNDDQNIPPDSFYERHGNGELLVRSDKFSFKPNHKGVTDMNIAVEMPSGQSYVYNFHAKHQIFYCEKCRQRGGKTTAKVIDYPSGEKCVILNENKHICTMPYASETVLHDHYESVKNHKSQVAFLIVFDPLNMEHGYEFQSNGNKFICKNCEKLSKTTTARLCVDQDDKQCVAFNTNAHECKMLNFVLGDRVIKSEKYKKIKNSNGEAEIVVFYDNISYRRFIHDPATDCYYCEACRKEEKNTLIKVLKNQNDEEFLLAHCSHSCYPYRCFTG